jgi:hypothetical protein
VGSAGVGRQYDGVRFESLGHFAALLARGQSGKRDRIGRHEARFIHPTWDYVKRDTQQAK